MNEPHRTKHLVASLGMFAAMGCSSNLPMPPATPIPVTADGSAKAPGAVKAPTVLASSKTRGINHLGLTVSDLDASVAFFIDALGWEKFGGYPDYPSVFVTNGLARVTLWQATDPKTATKFDRKNNVGLHHLAFTIPDVESLDELYQKLKDYPGVTMEFAPEPNNGGPTIHMMLRDPSGLRLEFAVPDGVHRKPAQ